MKESVDLSFCDLSVFEDKIPMLIFCFFLFHTDRIFHKLLTILDVSSHLFIFFTINPCQISVAIEDHFQYISPLSN